MARSIDMLGIYGFGMYCLGDIILAHNLKRVKKPALQTKFCGLEEVGF